MKFAVNTNSLRRHFAAPRIVELCRESGADGIEWGLDSLETAAADAEEMRRLTAENGLEVLSFINAGRLWEVDTIRRWSEAVAGAGGTMLRVAHPWFAWDYAESLHQPDSFTALLDRTRRGLERLMALGREFGLRYVLETHAGSCLASPLAAPLVMADCDPRYCGVIYDPANTCLEGFIRPRGAVEVIGKHLAYVHAKNLIVREETGADGKCRLGFEKRPLDRGMVDYEEVMFALKLARYDGWFSFEELYSPPEQFVDEIRIGISWLRACCRLAPDALQPPFSQFND